MIYSKSEIHAMMRDERYPLSSKYDPDWILDNSMGAHSLWLQEALVRDMHIRPGKRVLDLGCGKAISSIFMAKELGARVWATDLLISASENWPRIREAGVAELVCPIHADATALPFADGYFDAMTSVNSLFFYVTDGAFLREKLLRLVKPGGEIGVIVPGFLHAYADGIPDELKPYWSDQLDGWHTPHWWEDCFAASGMVEDLRVDTLPQNEGNALYRRSAALVNAHEEPFNVLAGDNITFIRILAKRKEA